MERERARENERERKANPSLPVNKTLSYTILRDETVANRGKKKKAASLEAWGKSLISAGLSFQGVRERIPELAAGRPQRPLQGS